MGGRPGVTLELGRTRHLDILIIADDVDHAIGAGLLGAFLKIDQGRQERGVARFDIVGPARARFAVRGSIPQVGDNRRRRLLAEEKLNRPVGLFTSLSRSRAALIGSRYLSFLAWAGQTTATDTASPMVEKRIDFIALILKFG